jgi:RNA polymerase sigma factor (sigma-70 family)
MTVPNEDLAARVMNGDRDAFDELVARYYRPIRFYVTRKVGQADAEDVAQDVFLKAWVALSRGQYRCDRGKFTTWLYRIALTTSFDLLRLRICPRNRGVKVPIDDQSVAPVLAALADRGPTVDEALSVREIWATVEALPPHHRYVVMLRLRRDGDTFETMARDEHVARSMLQRCYQDALACLRDTLSPHLWAGRTLIRRQRSGTFPRQGRSKAA